MKQLFSVVLSVLLLATVFAGCVQSGPVQSASSETPAPAAAAESSAPAEPIAPAEGADGLSGELIHWSWGDYEEKGAADFNQYYPNIKVNYVIVPDTEYDKKMQTTAASGAEMPDVVNFEMGRRGTLCNIDMWERLDAAPYNLNTDDLVDFSLALVQNTKGEINSVQIDNCVGGFAYNRALAKEYFGTDDPDEMEAIFTTMDVFIEKAQEVVSKSNGQVYMFASTGDVDSSMGAMFTSEPFVKDGKLNVEPTALPSFQFIEKLVTMNAIAPFTQWTPGWSTSFAQDNIVFYGAPSWFITWQIKANDPNSTGKWGFMSPPGGGFSWGGTSYAIPKGAKEENKLIAWEYIKWFTMSMEGTKSFMKAWETPTCYKPAIGTDVYAPAPDPYFGGQDVISKLLEIAANPKTAVRPMTEYDAAITAAKQDVVNSLLASGATADEALQALKDNVYAQAPDLQA